MVMTHLLVAFLSILPTPEFCLAYRQGYRAAVCEGLGPLCITAPRTYPACPSDGGTPQEGYNRGWDEGAKSRNH